MKKGEKEEDNRYIANKEIERMKEGDRRNGRKREKDIGLGEREKEMASRESGPLHLPPPAPSSRACWRAISWPTRMALDNGYSAYMQVWDRKLERTLKLGLALKRPRERRNEKERR
jgi:hypothetical protein